MNIDFSLAPYLSANEKRAIKKFINKVSSSYNICKIILFGSKARGDFNIHSDIDLLIITSEQINNSNRWKLSDITSDINIDYEVALNCVYCNETEWKSNNIVNQQLKNNIDRDGIEIAQ
jgi:predicted nucleotidyltransferase